MASNETSIAIAKADALLEFMIPKGETLSIQQRRPGRKELHLYLPPCRDLIENAERIQKAATLRARLVGPTAGMTRQIAIHRGGGSDCAPLSEVSGPVDVGVVEGHDEESFARRANEETGYRAAPSQERDGAAEVHDAVAKSCEGSEEKKSSKKTVFCGSECLTLRNIPFVIPPWGSDPDSDVTGKRSGLASSGSSSSSSSPSDSCFFTTPSSPQNSSPSAQNTPASSTESALSSESERNTHGTCDGHKHYYLPVLEPRVDFSSPDACPDTQGVAVVDIIEAGKENIPLNGLAKPLMKDPGRPAFREVNTHEDGATAVKIVVGWKGYPERMYDILVMCSCGSIITRGLLAYELALIQQKYFNTELCDTTLTTSKDIVHGIENLRLMSLYTKDNGGTWRTQHAVVA